MPFIRAELTEMLGAAVQLAYAAWRDGSDLVHGAAAEDDFAKLQSAVTAARSLRAEAEVPTPMVVGIEVDGDGASFLTENVELFEGLARVTVITGATGGDPGARATTATATEGTRTAASLSAALPDLELRLPLTGLVDLDQYRARQRSRLVKAEADVARSRSKLASEKFVASAPVAVVEEERRRLAEGTELIERISVLLERLG